MSIDELIKNMSALDFENFVKIDTVKPVPKVPYQVREIARIITAGIKDRKVMAYAIYNWITENVTYNKIANENFEDESSVIYSLKKKAGTCYSMTRLYVALAKSVGLDARIVKVLVDREGREIEAPGHVCAMVDFVTSHQLYDRAYEDSDAKHKKIEYYSRENTNTALIEDILNPYKEAIKIFQEKKDYINLVKCCDAALSLFPDKTYFKLKKEEVLLEAGIKKMETGQKDLAVLCFKEILKMDPNNEGARKILELTKGDKQ
jgi:tetratricopeptide (TPR) repeat protein